VCSLIIVQKSTPPTHVVNEYRFIVCIAVHDIFEQLLQSRTVLRYDTALSKVGIGLHNREAVTEGVLRDCRFLVINRELLRIV
jgi:hypothetical protein